jgi:hypothetical protein
MSRDANAERLPDCRYSCRMSGVFGQKFGRMNSTAPVRVSSIM